MKIKLYKKKVLYFKLSDIIYKLDIESFYLFKKIVFMRLSLQNLKAVFFLFAVFLLSDFAQAQCGYDIELTSDNLTIQGTIYNVEADGPDYPQNLEWYLPTDGTVLSSDANFETIAYGYGECAICVDYKVILDDGTECTEIICSTVNLADPLLSCNAEFSTEDYSGPMPVVGGVVFNNISTGDFTEWSWDFGDGSYDSESLETVTHFYQESGTYDVRLIVWNDTPQNCFSEYVKTIEVFISDDPCDQLDCVWPGDTDGSGAANLEDIINIGVGFGMTGPPRDSISTDWSGKPATDWELENSDGVNYKHFDCNGDGTINISDITAIQSNYVMLENGVTETESNGVPVSLSFDVDTVVITHEEQHLEINAGLNFGSSDVLMENVYGIVLYLTYPKHYVVASEPVGFEYNDNSFFGNNTNVLPMARNIQEAGQTDVVLTRNNVTNTSGQGRVASFSFIIESDIIDGRAINEGQDFAVHIHAVKAVDVDGNEINLSLPEDPASVFFQNGMTITKAVDLIEDNQLEIYPNPATDNLQISLSEELHPQEVEVFDLLGKRVLYSEMYNSQLELNVSRLQYGIYVLKVKTEEGIGTKKIMVER